jgi:hypothetical protein
MLDEKSREEIEAALARARRHGRAAAGESALALRALLDALSLVTQGVPSDASRWLAFAAGALDDAARGLGRDAPGDASLVGAISEALDAEIRRWEARAGVDRDARAVLRAYLGLREILWELGLRTAPTEPAPEKAKPQPASRPDAATDRPAPPRRAPPARGVERIRIDG